MKTAFNECSYYQNLIEHKREFAFDDTVLGWWSCQATKNNQRPELSRYLNFYS